jgi:integrase-like protein
VVGLLQGEARIAGFLMYGWGLRLLETLQLRVEDIDFTMGEVAVRRAKGGKDRVTVLPEAAVPELNAHLERVRGQHERDLKHGGGRAPLPYAFERKSPAAGKEWGWQYVFPATRRYQDPESGEWIRHHLHESVVQLARVSSTACHERSGEGQRYGRRATAWGIPSRPICCRMVTTFASSRNCWAIATWRRRWCTPMCSIAVGGECGVRRTGFRYRVYRAAELTRPVGWRAPFPNSRAGGLRLQVPQRRLGTPDKVHD